jgi:hypothetical protein
VQHFSLQPCLGQAPVSHHGIGPDIQHRRRFLDTEAAEEAEFDDASLARITLFERFQGIVELFEVVSWFIGHFECVFERDFDGAASTLLRQSRPSVIDQDAAHDASRHGQKMSAVLPVHAGGADEPEIGFVDERALTSAVAW